MNCFTGQLIGVHPNNGHDFYQAALLIPYSLSYLLGEELRLEVLWRDMPTGREMLFYRIMAENNPGTIKDGYTLLRCTYYDFLDRS